MHYWLYNTAITLAAPLGVGYLAASSRHRSALGRFFPRVPEMSKPPIWIHACSVGEVGVAQPLVAALAKRFPSVPLLLTASTVTGRGRAEAFIDGVHTAWFPFDHPLSVSRFLRQANPRVLVLIETELWPNVLRKTAEAGIPVALVNGRLSERHFRRYERSGRMVRNMISRLTVAGVQDEVYADRFEQLGLRRERIQITGNLKFDGVPSPSSQSARDTVRAKCGIPLDAPVVVFGSTRPGDERLAVESWRALRREWSDLFLVVAPRHVERADEIASLFSEPVQKRTTLQESAQHGEPQAIILDTHGELLDFYGVATLAVIGGSFDSAIQGHNPIESAAMGVPAIFGPHMRNFAGAAEALVNSDAAIQVPGLDDLTTALAGLLRDGDRRKRMGECGREVVKANRGALDRTIELLESTVMSDRVEIDSE